MILKIGMPNLGHTMEQGKLAEWLKRRGDLVAAGEALAVIETDKVTVELEAPAAGTLLEVLAEADAVVRVGATVALLGDASEANAAAAMAAQLAGPPADAPLPTGADAAPARSPREAERRGLASPVARARARELGVDLSGLKGSGPDGLVTRGDVEEAVRARSTPATTLAGERSGDGRRAIVLLHGFAGDREVWSPLRRRLDGTSIAFDLPGHGESPPSDAPSVLEIAELLAASLEDEPGPLHLVGHSLGAAICVAAAPALRARLASLTLIAPLGFGPRLSAAFVEALLSSSSPADTERALAHLLTPGQRVARPMVERMQAQLADPARRAALAAVAQANFPDGRQAFAGHDLLARLTCPVQAIWGRADRVIPAHHADALPDTVELHLLSGAGHLVQFEAPVAVADLIASLVARTTPGEPS